jgi:hypothetical protein
MNKRIARVGIAVSIACSLVVSAAVASGGGAAEQTRLAGPWYTPSELEALIVYSNASFAEKQAMLAGTARRPTARARSSSSTGAPGAEATGAAYSEAHWKHEDSISEANRTPSGRSLPVWLEAHWTHEDVQYNARTVSGHLQSAAPAVASGGGIDSLAALTAAGGVAALLIVGTVAVSGVRRKRG